MLTRFSLQQRQHLRGWAALGGLALCGASGLLGLTGKARGQSAQGAQWYEQALRMQRLAESWGDQSYGAVLVANDTVIGWGPSRVVKNQDPSAHAEREALRDALRGQTQAVRGSVLYSTSRPCAACEAAAARAGVARMVWGAALQDAGAPKP